MPKLKMIVQTTLKRFRLRQLGGRDENDFRRSGARIGRNFLGNGPEINLNDCPFITIGNDVGFGPGVMILAHDASMRAITGYTRMQEVHIGNNVFIGSRSIVLPGVTVGDGAIIGAGSLVNRAIPEAEVWAGVPARYITTVDSFRSRALEQIASQPTFEAGWKILMRQDSEAARIIATLNGGSGWFY